MALYKIGNRYLSEDEYQEHCEANWVLGLFLLGGVAGVLYISSLVPGDWPKAIRFVAIIGAAILGGGFLSFFAFYIRKAALFAVSIGIIAGTCYGVWLAV